MQICIDPFELSESRGSFISLEIIPEPVIRIGCWKSNINDAEKGDNKKDDDNNGYIDNRSIKIRCMNLWGDPLHLVERLAAQGFVEMDQDTVKAIRQNQTGINTPQSHDTNEVMGLPGVDYVQKSLRGIKGCAKCAERRARLRQLMKSITS